MIKTSVYVKMAAQHSHPTTFTELCVADQTVDETPVAIDGSTPIAWADYRPRRGTSMHELFSVSSRCGYGLNPRLGVDDMRPAIDEGVQLLFAGTLERMCNYLKFMSACNAIIAGPWIEYAILAMCARRGHIVHTDGNLMEYVDMVIHLRPTMIVYIPINDAMQQIRFMCHLTGMLNHSGDNRCRMLIDKEGYRITWDHRIGSKALKLHSIKFIPIVAQSREWLIPRLLNRVAVDSEAACTDGQRIFALPRCIDAWRSRLNILRPKLFTDTTESSIGMAFETCHDTLIPESLGHATPSNIDWMNIRAGMPSDVTRIPTEMDGGIMAIIDPRLWRRTVIDPNNGTARVIEAEYWGCAPTIITDDGDELDWNFMSVDHMADELNQFGKVLTAVLPSRMDCCDSDDNYRSIITDCVICGLYHPDWIKELLAGLQPPLLTEALSDPRTHDADLRKTREAAWNILKEVHLPTLDAMCGHTLDDIFPPITSNDVLRWNNWLCWK